MLLHTHKKSWDNDAYNIDIKNLTETKIIRTIWLDI